MKFKSYKSSIFTEVFIGRDHRTFELAYNGSKGDHTKAVDVGYARQWVKDVLTVFAGKIDISFPQAVMLFQTGDVDAVRRIYRGYVKQFTTEYAKWVKAEAGEMRSRRLEELDNDIKQANLVVEMDGQDLVNWLREQFVFALTLSHPERKINPYSGRTFMNKPAPKVGEKSEKTTTTEVVRKNNKVHNPKLLPDAKTNKVIEAARGHAAVMNL